MLSNVDSRVKLSAGTGEIGHHCTIAFYNSILVLLLHTAVLSVKGICFCYIHTYAYKHTRAARTYIHEMD